MAAMNLKIISNSVSSDRVDWPRLFQPSYHHNLVSNPSFCGRKVLHNDRKLLLHPTSGRRNRLRGICVSASNRFSESQTHSFDVVIIGAGIIGLYIAREVLLRSNLSVAVVDAGVPGAATGAGIKLAEVICQITFVLFFLSSDWL